jgi:hypothetical protein
MLVMPRIVHMASIPPPPPGVLWQPQPQPPVPSQPAMGPQTPYLWHWYSKQCHQQSLVRGAYYADLIVQYVMVVTNRPESLTMLCMLSYGPAMLQAFIMLMAVADPALMGNILLMHHPTKHPLLVPAMQWDETIMAFKGGTFCCR